MKQNTYNQFHIRHSVKGFTLPEVLLASVILAFVVMALTQAITAGQMQTYHAIKEKRAIELAEALMSEVLLLSYADSDGSVKLGPEGDESGRDQYDNLDDYHGYQQGIGDVKDLGGDLLPEVYQDYAREVKIRYATQSVTAFGLAYSGIEITVVVTDRDNREWKLIRFVCEPEV